MIPNLQTDTWRAKGSSYQKYLVKILEKKKGVEWKVRGHMNKMLCYPNKVTVQIIKGWLAKEDERIELVDKHERKGTHIIGGDTRLPLTFIK